MAEQTVPEAVDLDAVTWRLDAALRYAEPSGRIHDGPRLRRLLEVDLRAMAAEIERLRAEATPAEQRGRIQDLRREVERLTAALAEARSEITESGGAWRTEYGAVNDNADEFVPFAWLNIDDPSAAQDYARIVGRPPMQRRVWNGRPEPIPATEAEND